MQKLGIEEAQKYALGIAKVFDEICTKHHIPYFMVQGTMLGAIRHHGFIPWDDDMDFGVPIEYYEQLEEILIKELPFPYRCCTYKNHPSVILTFMKIEDVRTVNDKLEIRLPLEKKIGINIDVFPLNYCIPSDPAIKRLRWKAFLLGSSFGNSSKHRDSILRKWIKSILRFLLGGRPIYLQNSIRKNRLKVVKGNYIGNLTSKWGDGDIVPQEWYGKGKRYIFEDTTFVGPEKYDEYLTSLYGDYMTPPPEGKRIPHAEDRYLKDVEDK